MTEGEKIFKKLMAEKLKEFNEAEQVERVKVTKPQTYFRHCKCGNITEEPLTSEILNLFKHVK